MSSRDPDSLEFACVIYCPKLNNQTIFWVYLRFSNLIELDLRLIWQLTTTCEMIFGSVIYNSLLYCTCPFTWRNRMWILILKMMLNSALLTTVKWRNAFNSRVGISPLVLHSVRVLCYYRLIATSGAVHKLRNAFMEKNWPPPSPP